ncbi:MAG: hypothetical protein JWN98_1683 [Abditibacteriota bacterium]|nr:hypothetical protein [Abditibacteriota bacterium]
MRIRRAFTLIEILIVLAIIGILAALLFPVFSRAREGARRAACASNLKQIGLSVAQYSQDYDEHLPYGYLYYGPGLADLMMWEDLVQPYAKSYQVMVCPGHSAPIQYDFRRKRTPSPFAKSYAANEVFDAPGSTLAPMPRTNPFSPPTPLAALADVTMTILIGECPPGDATVAEFDAYAKTDIGFDGVGPLCNDKRHTNGSNWLFADGHVKWLRQTQTRMWTIKDD